MTWSDGTVHRHGRRAEWSTVPVEVRAAVEDLIGATVTSAVNADGGFSPGPAARCTTDDGRAVFVKACGVEINPIAPAMHRREAAVLAMLPADFPAPTLIGVVDAAGWVVLVTDVVDGRMPTAPLVPHVVASVLDAADLLARRGSGLQLPGLEPFGVAMRRGLFAWQRLRSDRTDEGLDPWTRRHLDALVELESGWIEATAGTALVHGDLRTDNILLDETGVTIVDWPNASLGQPWVDLVGMLPSLHLDGAPPPAVLFAHHPIGAEADGDAVNAFLAALAGYFTRMSLQPPPPGIETVRSFQAAQGAITRAWLAERLGWR